MFYSFERIICMLHFGALKSKSRKITVVLTVDIMMAISCPSMQLPPNDGRQLFVYAVGLPHLHDVVATNLKGNSCDGAYSKWNVSKLYDTFRMSDCSTYKRFYIQNQG